MNTALEALAFAAIVMADIWLAVGRAPWAAVLPVPLMVWSWRAHRRTPRSLGLAADDFRNALKEWWAPGLVVLGVLFMLLGSRMLTASSLRRAVLYFVWSSVQQLALQSMIYLPLRESVSKGRAAFLTGIIFAAVHWPNPVLVAGTFGWGVASALLFERWRSIWALGLAQVPLSSLLLAVTPGSWNHGFHIGPFY